MRKKVIDVYTYMYVIICTYTHMHGLQLPGPCIKLYITYSPGTYCIDAWAAWDTFVMKVNDKERAVSAPSML